MAPEFVRLGFPIAGASLDDTRLHALEVSIAHAARIGRPLRAVARQTDPSRGALSSSWAMPRDARLPPPSGGVAQGQPPGPDGAAEQALSGPLCTARGSCMAR